MHFQEYLWENSEILHCEVFLSCVVDEMLLF